MKKTPPISKESPKLEPVPPARWLATKTSRQTSASCSKRQEVQSFSLLRNLGYQTCFFFSSTTIVIVDSTVHCAIVY
jgi:hypothetical protein